MIAFNKLNDLSDNTSLVLLRIFFGLLVFLESIGSIFTGWVKKTFVDVPFTFNFIEFNFLQFLPGKGMYLYYILMSIPALGIMLGYKYRWSVSLFGLMWSVTYLLQKTHYNNHYYLIILLCFLFLFVPAHKRGSLDAKFNPRLLQDKCPRWCIDIFKVQFAIIFFYAALAKLNPDWLNGEPIGTWLKNKSSYPIIGSILGMPSTKWWVAYGGIFFDFLIAPAMFWKKSRLLAFFVAIFFHLFNSAVFLIGVFPYLMIFYALIFFDLSVLGKRLFPVEKKRKLKPFTTHKLVTFTLVVYFIFQALYPARHFLMAGNVNWTEEGHRHSWRMMLRAKKASIHYQIIDKNSGERFKDYPSKILSKDQSRKLGRQPDMIWQYAQYLKEKYKREGKDVEVYARSKCGLNGRKYQTFIDPETDLANTQWSHFKVSPWILPLE